MSGELTNFIHRLKFHIFEAVFAFFCIFSGLSGLLKFGFTNDIFAESIGTILAIVFNLGYFFAGLFMMGGLGTSKRNIEAVGLILVATELLTRMFVIGVAVGINSLVIGMYIFNTAFIAACIGRVRQIYAITKGAL